MSGHAPGRRRRCNCRQTGHRKLSRIPGLVACRRNGVIVVLGLHHRERDVRFVEQQVVGFPGFAALHGLAADDDAAFGEIDSSRSWVITSHSSPFVPTMAGVMSLVRTSASVSSFLFNRWLSVDVPGRAWSTELSQWNIGSVSAGRCIPATTGRHSLASDRQACVRRFRA